MLLNGYVLKQAWQNLKKSPAFVMTVVTTMGTTLGALTCVLTLAYLLIFQPLPYPDQERIYNVDYTHANNFGVVESQAYNFPSLLHLYEHHNVFEQAAIVSYTQNVITSLAHQPTMPVAFVSPEFLQILDAPLLKGRIFDEREGLHTEHQVAILSYNTWKNDFNGDPDILSQSLRFKGRSFKVIGVTAQNFVEPKVFRKGINTGVWFPWDLHLNQKSEPEWDWAYNMVYFLGKLPDGYSANKAEQQITNMMDGLWKTYSESKGYGNVWSVTMKMRLLSEEMLGEQRSVVYLLIAGVLGLVSIAVANITNLFVSRTTEQQNTLAIHAAVGAKKSDLRNVILAEAFFLMLMSLLLALTIASGGFYLLQTFLKGLLPRVDELIINNVSVFSACFIALMSALFFAFISSKMINYRVLSLHLQSGGKGTGVQVSKTIRQVLITSQVAIATVLIFANISLFASAVTQINRSTGMEVGNIYHTRGSRDFPL